MERGALELAGEVRRGGSGTTSLAAELEGRSSIGYEINRDFEPVIREKLSADRLALCETSSGSFEHRQKSDRGDERR